MLTFSAERCGDHLGVMCSGTDAHGAAVTFQLDPVSLRHNLERQTRWAIRVEVVDQLLTAYLDSGVAPDTAWTMIAALLPAAISSDTSWQSPAQRATQIDDESLYDGDEDFGQSGDGDHRVGGSPPRQ